MANPSRFIIREVVRCEDCEIRADLKEDGHPVDQEALHRIRRCSGCHGRPIDVCVGVELDEHGREVAMIETYWGHVPAPSKADPYDGVDQADPYVRRRAQRAEAARLAAAPRPVRRRYLDIVRLESFMEEA